MNLDLHAHLRSPRRIASCLELLGLGNSCSVDGRHADQLRNTSFDHHIQDGVAGLHVRLAPLAGLRVVHTNVGESVSNEGTW